MKSFKKQIIQASALALAVSLPMAASFATTTHTNHKDNHHNNAHHNNNTHHNNHGKANNNNKLNDAAILAAIKLKQATEPPVSPFSVNVDVKNGMVTLTGLVKTNVQYEKAIMQASSVDNVQDVDASGLKVQDSDQPMTDTIITAKVKGKLLQSQLFGSAEVDAWGVTVETKNGEVFLVGKVATEVEKSGIEKVAKSVMNVKSVNSSGLTVEPAAEETATDNGTATVTE